MKVVTVHRGARDEYQVACALHEAGMLESLVTDLYWPANGWMSAAERAVPGALRRKLRNRTAELLPGQAVRSCWPSGSVALLCDNISSLPFWMKRASMRLCDRRLGRRAAAIANRNDTALLSYSYYAHSAFSHSHGSRPRILFQLHPHPANVRTILQRERELHPECAGSLDKEWELALPEREFQSLVEECSMPDYWIAASSFTKNTLIEHGAPAERIQVIPYGTDLGRFTPASMRRLNQPLRLLFVGTVCQRKGVKYLVDALEALPAGTAELSICGRLVDDAAILRNRRAPIRLLSFVSPEELLREFQSADVFVFPSLAEGFGHVLLEAMACGLPVISTTHTAAPDLISDGREGFITEPGDTAGLVKCLEYFLKNRGRVSQMGTAARARAEAFTWATFRQRIAEAVREMIRRD